MKPKYSTGYLTPQASKSKTNCKLRGAESNENIAKDLREDLLQRLVDCPLDRQILLDMYKKKFGKGDSNKYKRNIFKDDLRGQLNTSPLQKTKRNYICESPTALLRRRVLERQNNDNISTDTQDSNQSDSSSQSSSSIVSCSTPIAYNKLLEGVVAYVEIRSKDQDRSAGAKALMRSMGATIRDKFTKDVTHVIFKDGSFTTYQRAKLTKVHLVSVLWIDAVRNSKMRVPEKKFPALGTDAFDTNVSTICSQLQKEYEDIIREELNRSLATGTPLPSTRNLIDRRRTLMTPVPSSCNRFSQELSSQDKEVEKILRRQTIGRMHSVEGNLSPDLTSDESDISPFINGNITKHKNELVLPNPLETITKLENSNMDLTCPNNTVHGNVKKKRNSISENKMDLTEDLSMSEHVQEIKDSSCENEKENCTPNISNESLYYKETPKIKKTENLNSDKNFNVPDENLYKRRTRQLSKVVNQLNNDANDASHESKPKNNLNGSSSTNMSVLELSDKASGVQILSKNVCTNNVLPGNASNDCPDITSNILVEKSSSTNMSSLQISTKTSEGVSTSTNMSALLVSSDLSTNKIPSSGNLEKNNISGLDLSKERKSLKSKESFNSDKSFTPIKPDVVDHVLKVLGDDTPLKDEYITKRKKTRRKTALPPDISGLKLDNECNINLSEEVSPSKRIKNNISTVPSQNMDSVGKNKRHKGKMKDNRTNLVESELIISLTDIHITPNNENGKIDSKSTSSSDRPRRTKGKKTFKSSDSSEDSTISGNDKKLNKTRKLYNPDEFIKDIIIDDDIERERKRTEVKTRKSIECKIINPKIVTISPNTFVTAKAKEFIDRNKIDVKTILNKDSESENEVKLPKKPKIKKKDNKVSSNSDADEQHELAAQYIYDNNKIKGSTTKQKEKIATRRSVRLTQSSKKKLDMNSSLSSSDEKNIAPVTPLINRRSTMEFQSKTKVSLKKLKIDRNKRPSIVCTKLHKDEIQVFNQIVRKLGGFVIEDEVSNKTTHLVAGEPKRTINMLRAIAMGCWILKHEWLLKSLEEGKWLPEEDYEETDFSPAVQQCRLQRQAFGPSYTMDVFQDCGSIFVAQETIPRCSDLKELVTLCKGNVTTTPRNATIAVGKYVRYEGIKCVTEAWILDCITFNKRMPLKKYLIPPTCDSPTV